MWFQNRRAKWRKRQKETDAKSDKKKVKEASHVSQQPTSPTELERGTCLHRQPSYSKCDTKAATIRQSNFERAPAFFHFVSPGLAVPVTTQSSLSSAMFLRGWPLLSFQAAQEERKISSIAELRHKAHCFSVD